jgi:hypothetical protein
MADLNDKFYFDLKQKEDSLREARFSEQTIKEFHSSEVSKRLMSEKQEIVEDDETDYFDVYNVLREYIGKSTNNLVDEMLQKPVEQRAEYLDLHWPRGAGQSLVNAATKYHTGKGYSPPDPTYPADTGWSERQFEKAATIGVDLPVYATGAAIGATAAKTALKIPAVASTVGRVALAKPTLIMTTAGVTAGYLTDSLRATYLEALERGDVNTPSEWWDIFLEVGHEEGLKGAATLGLTLGGPIALNLSKWWSKYIARYSALTATPHVIEGTLPSKEELIDNAVLLAAFSGAPHGGKMVVDRMKRTSQNGNEVIAELMRKTEMQEDAASVNFSSFRVDKEARAKYLKEEGAKITARHMRALEEAKVKPEESQPSKPWYMEKIDKMVVDEKATPFMEKLKNMREGKSTKEWFIDSWVDRQHPAFRDTEIFEKAGGRFNGNNWYETLRIQPGSLQRAMSFINKETLNFDLSPRGKPLVSILEDIATKETKVGKVYDAVKYNEFRNYAISERVLEQHAKGLETGFDIKAAEAVVAKLGKYHKANQERIKHAEEVIDYAWQGRALSKEALEIVREANKNYAGFARIFEVQDRARATIGDRPLLKKFKGSKAKIADPFTTQYHNTIRIIQSVDMNKAIRDYIEGTQVFPELFPDIHRVKGVKKIILSNKEISELVETPSKYSQKAKDNIAIFRPDFRNPTETQVRFINKQGKQETWEVGKTRARSIQDLNKYQNDIVMQVLGGPARLLRAGATLDPIFMLRNMSRDTFQGAAFSHNDFVPIYHTVAGLFNMIDMNAPKGAKLKGNDLYKSFTQSGAMQSFLNTFDRNYVQKSMKAEMQSTKWHNQIRHPIEFLRVAAEFAESAPRIADYGLTLKRLLKENEARVKEGLPPLTRRQIIERGGFESRKLTIDFGRMGFYVQGMNALIPFYAARINGLTRIVEEFKARPKEVSAKIVELIVMPSVLIWAANRDWEWDDSLAGWKSKPNKIYEGLNPTVKHQNWIFISGDPSSDRQIVWKFPKSHELGYIAGTGTEVILDYMHGKDPEAIDDWLGKILFDTAAGVAPLPQIAVPYFENILNHNFYQDRPIIPERAEKLLPTEAYTRNTSKWARILGKYLEEAGAATWGGPAYIENYWNSYTGALGRYFSNAVDTMLQETGVVKKYLNEEEMQDPAKFWNEYFPLASFTARHSSTGGYYPTKFWEAYKSVKRKLDSLKEKKGDRLRQKEYLRLLRKTDMRMEFLEKIYQGEGENDGLKDLYSHIKNIYELPVGVMSGAEQRQLIDELAAAIIHTTEMAVKHYREIKNSDRRKTSKPYTAVDFIKDRRDALPSLYK